MAERPTDHVPHWSSTASTTTTPSTSGFRSRMTSPHPLLEDARLDREPPSVIKSDAIGRLLVVCAFANAARDWVAGD
jgi:hypothetical protein